MLRVITAALIVLTLSISASAGERPDSILIEYIEAIKNAEWKKSENLWESEFIERSRRFGIEYDNVPAKYDCASPVVLAIDGIRAGLADYEITRVDADSSQAKITLRLSSATDTLTVDYYAAKKDNRWLLTAPVYTLSADWYHTETKYVKLFFSDSSQVNKYALDELDRFIEQTLKLFNVPDERAEILRREKIDYYLCTEAQFVEITGHEAHGIYDIPSDAIISRHLPHKHELVHLLVNFRLQNLPLYTLPVLQEGLAVAVGGRWGKSPGVLIDLGRVMVASDFASADSLLTAEDFYRTGPADMTYPVAGLVVKTIIDTGGMDSFLRLYSSLSGSGDRVAGIRADDFKKSFSSVFGYDWETLKNRINDSLKVLGAGIAASNENTPPNEPIHLQEDGITCDIFKDGEYYTFHISSSQPNANVAMLFSDTSTAINPKYQSWMFAEQCPDRGYRRYRYGLPVNSSEAGLYDYYLNELVAKSIAGLYPGSDYISDDGREYRFIIDVDSLDFSSSVVEIIRY